LTGAGSARVDSGDALFTTSSRNLVTYTDPHTEVSRKKKDQWAGHLPPYLMVSTHPQTRPLILLRRTPSIFPLFLLPSVLPAPSASLVLPPLVVVVALHVPQIDALQFCGPAPNPPEEPTAFVKAFQK
jgi:hypothetical protein